MIRDFRARSGSSAPLIVTGEDDRKHILSETVADKLAVKEIGDRISDMKQSLVPPEEAVDPEIIRIFRAYDNVLRQSGAVDFDDLVSYPVFLFQTNHGFLEGIHKGVRIRISENTTDKNEAEFIARSKV